MFFFIFGLSVGSFLNVLIDRLPKGEQVIKGRSYCDYCHKKLGFFDLIPLLSFLFLAGKCRYCGKKISLYYPTVELVSGVMFITVSHFFPLSLITIYLLLITSCLIVIFFADLKYGIIPDEMILAGVISSLPLVFGEKLIYSSVIPLSRYPVINNLTVGIITSALFFFLLVLTRGRGMGMGDVKLAFLMGFFLGWPKILTAIYLAFLTGAVIGVILILIKKKRFGETLPFGPFLVIGTIVTIFWGEEIIKWWLRLV